jgi:hypothetical protein
MAFARRQCTPNTRVLILAGLRNWNMDTRSPNVYWMSGMAGTGKTTIACSLCAELERSGLLGASFFCSRSLPECQDVTRIVPTIAYQLARRSVHFQSVLCRVLSDDPDIGTRHPLKQFEKLMCDPLEEVKATLPPGLTIVIDALDECVDRNGAQLILETLFRHAMNLPVKFFVTCRPEPGVYETAQSKDSLTRSVLHLQEIERSLVQADIEVYLTEELASAGFSEAQIKLLADRAGSLFIYAATAVRYIRPGGTSAHSHRRLKAMLEMSSDSSNKQYEKIDELYAAVISNALNSDVSEPWEVETIRLILHTVICAREAMTIETLAGLLKLDDIDGARLALEPLRSVVYVSESTGLVSTLHASFPDFMLSHERSGSLVCNQKEHNKLLAQRCFETMSNSLFFNICNLQSSFAFDEDVSGLTERISAISAELFYACRYWGDHLELAEPSEVLRSLAEDFLSQRLLFWMEVLNLKQCIGAGGPILSQAHMWLQVGQCSANLTMEY